MPLVARAIRALVRGVGEFGETAIGQITGRPSQTSAPEYSQWHRIYCPEHGWVYHRVHAPTTEITPGQRFEARKRQVTVA